MSKRTVQFSIYRYDPDKDDALIQAIQLFTIFWRLKALALGWRIVVDQIGFDRVILFEELGHIDDHIANHRQTGKRTKHDGLFELIDISQTGQTILTVDIHGIRTTNTFTAGSAIGNSVVLCL